MSALLIIALSSFGGVGLLAALWAKADYPCTCPVPLVRGDWRCVKCGGVVTPSHK